MEHQLFIVKTVFFVKSFLILLTLLGVFKGTINYDCIFTICLSILSTLRGVFEGTINIDCIFTTTYARRQHARSALPSKAPLPRS